jgi:cobalt-zinc-cadmium efflux system outer membrane protein
MSPTAIVVLVALALAGGETPRPTAEDLPAFEAPAKPPEDPAPTPPPVVEPEGPLTLEDAWSLALLHNPELATFSWEVRASEARAVQAGKALNPELELRFTRLSLNNDDPSDDEVGRRVMLRQGLELGGERGRREELGRAETKLAQADYEAQREEVASEVARRFAALLGAERRNAAVVKAVELGERTREQVAKLVETGAVAGLETHRSRQQVALLRLELERARADRDAARLALSATWGSSTPRFTEAVGDLERITPLPELETVLALAREGPAVSRSASDLERSRSALRLAKAGRVPDLTLGAGVRWEDDSSRGNDYLFEVEFELPLFDRNQGSVQEGKHGVAKAEAARQAAEIDTVETASELYHAARAAGARATLLHDEVLPATRAALETVRIGFEGNAETPDNLFDALRDATRAEIEYADALVEHQQLLALLEALLGQPVVH